MKLFFHLVSLLVILSSTAIGQKNISYKYSYRIETKKRIDTGIIKLDITTNLDGSYKFSSSLFDNNGNPLLFESTMLITKNSKVILQTDTLGKAVTKIAKGLYNIALYSPGLKIIDSALNITEEMHTSLNFSIDRTMPNAFIIHSVRKLTRKEIKSIKHCVEVNKLWNECKQKELFTLGIEI